MKYEIEQDSFYVQDIVFCDMIARYLKEERWDVFNRLLDIIDALMLIRTGDEDATSLLSDAIESKFGLVASRKQEAPKQKVSTILDKFENTGDRFFIRAYRKEEKWFFDFGLFDKVTTYPPYKSNS